MTKAQNKKDPVEQVKETALDLMPFAVQLFDPEIITSPLVVISSVSQGIGAMYAAKFKDWFKKQKEEKKLRAEHPHTEKPALILRELMQKINKAEIDEEHFQALKLLFFNSLRVGSNENDEIEAYQFMEICNRLSSVELLILAANYRIAINKNKPVTPDINLRNAEVKYWAAVIATEMGHEFPEMVLLHEKNLVELRLFSGVEYQMNTSEVRNHYVLTDHFRLTNMGFRLCEILARNEE